MNRLFLVLLLLLCVDVASAATISGTIYDISLNRVNNAIVEINTIPNQRLVAKDGSYSFSVPVGDYRIVAGHKSIEQALMTQEDISVKDDGDYVLDLFMFPELDEELVDEDFVIDPRVIGKTNYLAYVIVFAVVFVLILLTVLAFVYYKKLTNKPSIAKEDEKGKEEAKHKEEDKNKETRQTQAEEPDIDKMLDFIKRNDGRVTQKEIRKEFPLSEAKISLMLTELEHKGLVKRIKKGRGNVVVLNK